jgi:hypothetical protein
VGTQKTAFLMMWISPDLDDVRDVVRDVFQGFGISATRVDEVEHEGLITERIKEQIRASDFLFADLTGERPSVYYEVGYAHALNRPVILFRKKGTLIHFDLAGHNCPDYLNLADLRKKLTRRLEAHVRKSDQGVINLGQAELSILYFSYGSNMCTGRLRSRVDSASPVGIAHLSGYSLRFHKRSKDGSAKANAFFTGKPGDVIWGVIFNIQSSQKSLLDRAEGLGAGYAEESVVVVDEKGNQQRVFMYVADQSAIADRRRPYSWYKRFVIQGAKQHGLPPEYVASLDAVVAVGDPDADRDHENHQVTC